MIKSFEELGIKREIIEALQSLNIKEPTEVQELSIPLALEGKNIIGQSQTGTGKTLAYLVPVLQKVEEGKKEMQALIVAPTHELVAQINNEIVSLKQKGNLNITSTTLIGSGNLNRQIEKLKNKPNIIVGSAGRILELIKKKKIAAHTIKTIVLDEGDKLFDKKNLEIVKGIIKSTQKDTQKLLFSATLGSKTLEIAKDLIGECEVIKVKEEDKVNSDIIHGYFIAENREKIDMLRKILHAEKNNKTIVFIGDSYNVDLALSKLRFHKVKVEALHGEAKKAERQKAIENFRKGKSNVLIATDVAARGLDIKGITHVINLTMPRDKKDYLHRVGRVGRLGEVGIAYSLIDPREEKIIKEFEKDLKINIPKKYIYKGEIIED
ncbi:DEAD/DEAH box helicase [Clostridium fallax]|uniref:Superfamily II DNA and RNA helicase n=1 Tax=Clostridium fallax TaxID=1533 RepID=A0A1M4Y1D4_9CLOT|nr:DEAD/DEAH box helicase [Clostridium fallax]SHE99525.1 Superfamily II DNA and RNA helicase [Clostridium fallax]SQB07770.1 ATP-dependent RNA helicase [Clostridium fallax]